MKYSISFLVLLLSSCNSFYASQPDAMQTETGATLSDSVVDTSGQKTTAGRILMTSLGSIFGGHSTGDENYTVVNLETAAELKKLESERERKIEQQNQELAALRQQLEDAQEGAKKDRKALVAAQLDAERQKNVDAGARQLVQNQRAVLQEQHETMKMLRHRTIATRWQNVAMRARHKKQLADVLKQLGVVKFAAGVEQQKLLGQLELLQQDIDAIAIALNHEKINCKKLAEECGGMKKQHDRSHQRCEELAAQIQSKEIQLEKACTALSERDALIEVNEQNLALAVKARDELEKAIRDTNNEDNAWLEEFCARHVPALPKMDVVKANA